MSYCPTCRGPSGTGGECGRCLKGPWWELEDEPEGRQERTIMLEAKTIFQSAVSKWLIEGTIRGTANIFAGTATVNHFIVESAETAEGVPKDYAHPIIETHALGIRERAFLERVLLEHAVEEAHIALSQRFTIKGALFDDYNGDVDVFVKSFTPGNPYGHFCHRTGAAEPPTGPECDIAVVRDAKTFESIELTDRDYEIATDAVGYQILMREHEHEAAYFDQDDTDDSAFYR